MTCDRCPMNEACISKFKARNGKGCPKKLEICSQSVSRTFELDRPLGGDENGSGTYIDLPDEATDIIAIVEDKELLDALISALDRLSPDDRKLWDFLNSKARKQVIADHFNLTLDGVRYREQRLFKILRSDGTLKRFFEKD